MGEGILIFVVQENETCWGAASPHLGAGFVVLAPTRDEVVVKMEALLAPLVAHGLRYRFFGAVCKDGPIMQ